MATNKWPTYIGVLDFEATCDDNKGYGHEIIEFPTVLLKFDETKQNYVVIDEFREYCLPPKKPQLTKFCKELTGITQEQVNNGSKFVDCINRHYKWLVGHLGKYDPDDTEFLFLTCGFWD